MYQNDPKRVLTPECRLSYCNLVTARAPQNGVGDPKFSVTLLIPKSNPNIKQELDAAMNAAAEVGVNAKWNGVRPARIESVVHDGDGVRPSGEPFGEECRGCWVVTASSKNKPYVCGADNVNCELAPTDIYSGMREFEGMGNDPAPEDDTAWAEKLQRTQDGKIKSTIDNVLIILDGDPLLKGKFALNQFAGRGEVLGPLPWKKDGKRRLWSDTDSNGLYWYMERFWGISGRGNIDSALDIHASQHAFNEVREYIERLTWDGVPRLDTLFIDYLGAKDTAYNRAVCRKSFTAAVTRAMIPGYKYDNMVILAGPQGIGKSTLLDKMSRGWFNDSIRTFEGKDASELLQGVWLVEVSELDAFRKTDVARIKQFLSLRADRYRAAYGRHVSELPRQCVFFGSTNTTDFLQDTTGNRRFWPVDVGEQPHAKTVWRDLTDDVIDQLWAEAKARWQAGESLYLSGDVEQEAKIKQEEHREVSVREGMIEEFVEKQVPVDWAKWPLDRRRDYWCGATRTPDGQELELVDRDRISAVEIWCERLNGNIRDMKPADTREINAILAKMDGWKRNNNPLRFGPYGQQRGFARVRRR